MPTNGEMIPSLRIVALITIPYRAAHTDKAHIRDYPLPVPHIYSREATLHNQGVSRYCILQSHTFSWLLGGHMTSKYESSIPSTKASKREAF